ncbi:RloB family protein [Actinocorallia lasiicapitis]
MLREGPTEHAYFDALKRFDGFKRRGSVLDISVFSADHRNLVRQALKRRNEDYDEIWCVLDTELDPVLVKDLQNLIKGTNVRLALSAPSFEFWLILHRTDRRSPFQTAKEAERMMEKLVPGWKKGAGFVYTEFVRDVRKAASRAGELGGGPEQNPSSDVWRLIELLVPPGDERAPGLRRWG